MTDRTLENDSSNLNMGEISTTFGCRCLQYFSALWIRALSPFSMKGSEKQGNEPVYGRSGARKLASDWSCRNKAWLTWMKHSTGWRPFTAHLPSTMINGTPLIPWALAASTIFSTQSEHSVECKNSVALGASPISQILALNYRDIPSPCSSNRCWRQRRPTHVRHWCWPLL